MATRTPVFYDSTAQDHRPMDAGDVVPGSTIPISATAGNQLQLLSDGLYSGAEPGTAVYVDSTNGSDSNNGAEATPFKTMRGAWNALIAKFPDGVYRGQNIHMALRCGMTHVHDVDFSLVAGAQISVTFYGDATYGDFNSAQVAGTTNPWNMSDLNRPVIVPSVIAVGTLFKIAGWNLQGGELLLQGVSVQLPAQASNPSITVVSAYADYVRSIVNSDRSALSLEGTIFNMTDTGSYWGALGSQARSSLSVRQFASQFQILGQQIVSGQPWTTTVLNARQYFIKFYPDVAGNNQNNSYLQQTAQTASGGSGTIFMSWSDTESLTVTGAKTNQASFPFAFLQGYGLIQYVYGLNRASNGTYLNLVSSRLM